MPLPGLLVFFAEMARHEWLHDLLPPMAGNAVTGAVALGARAIARGVRSA